MKQMHYQSDLLSGIQYTQQMNPEQLQLFNNARTFLDRGIHSCQQWWASKRPWYSPDMILRGLSEILMAGVNVKRSIPEDLVEDIPKTIDVGQDD